MISFGVHSPARELCTESASSRLDRADANRAGADANLVSSSCMSCELSNGRSCILTLLAAHLQTFDQDWRCTVGNGAELQRLSFGAVRQAPQVPFLRPSDLNDTTPKLWSAT